MFNNGNYILRAGATLKSKKHHIIVQAQIWCFSDFSVACSLTLVIINQAAFEYNLTFVIR